MDNHPYKEQIQECLQMFDEARQFVDNTLKDTDLTAVKISIDAQLVRISNTLSALLGGVTSGISNVPTDFPQLTSMFGSELQSRTPVDLNRLAPTKTEQDLFLERRDELYDRFPSMDNDAILKYLNEPKGEALIRSVAKKANISNFREAEINIDFLDEIKASIEDIAQLNEAIALADAGAASIVHGNYGDDEDEEIEEDDHEPVNTMLTEKSPSDTQYDANPETSDTAPKEPEKADAQKPVTTGKVNNSKQGRNSRKQ